MDTHLHVHVGHISKGSAITKLPPPPHPQDYVSSQLGQRFIEPQTADLHLAFKDSSTTSPLIFILSTGTDPAADLYKFAEEMKFHKKLSAISLGQGQVRYHLNAIGYCWDH